MTRPAGWKIKDLKRKGLGCSRPVEALVRQQVFGPFVRRLDF